MLLSIKLQKRRREREKNEFFMNKSSVLVVVSHYPRPVWRRQSRPHWWMKRHMSTSWLAGTLNGKSREWWRRNEKKSKNEDKMTAMRKEMRSCRAKTRSERERRKNCKKNEERGTMYNLWLFFTSFSPILHYFTPHGNGRVCNIKDDTTANATSVFVFNLLAQPVYFSIHIMKRPEAGRRERQGQQANNDDEMDGGTTLGRWKIYGERNSL